MNDININATQWTIEADGELQTIVLENGEYVVMTLAKPWTQWSSHVSHGSQIGDKKTPRRIAKRCETLEEATKFAVDLLTAEVKLKQAQRDLDEATKTMKAC